MHIETLTVALLPAEGVRHAAMRLCTATHPRDNIGEWERWASAWHMIQTFRDGAISRADEQIAMLRTDGSLPGVGL